MRNKKVLYLTQAAVIAALYVALTWVFAPVSFREVQVRVSEMLTILPLFTPAAVPGLFVGCILANMLGGAIPLDVIFGSLATLAGAIGTWAIGKTAKPGSKIRYLAPLPPIAANTIVVPLVLYYGYGVNLPIPLQMLTVGLGEVISCGVFGILLMTLLTRFGNRIFSPEGED